MHPLAWCGRNNKIQEMGAPRQIALPWPNGRIRSTSRRSIPAFRLVLYSIERFTAILSNTSLSSMMAEIIAPPTLATDASAPVQSIDAPIPVPGAATEAPAPPAEPEFVSETLYIQNLNEKIKLSVLKQSLRSLFKTYGEVVDVVAHSNLRMRGQAFVSFESPEVAKKALKEVRGFPLYSKPMVCLS